MPVESCCSANSLDANQKHPIIDCSALISQQFKGDEKQQILNQILEAVQKRGYFYAKGVPSMPDAYIKSVHQYLKEVHSLPVEVKKNFVKPNGTYTGLDLGKEYAEHDYVQGTTSSVRSWDYSRSRSCEGKGNQYPAKDIVSKSFEVFLDDLYERQNALGSALMTAFAEMLDLPSDTFNKHYTAGDLGTIRLLFYPGMENNSQEIVDDGISAHTDFEAFTLMHQDAPGLQFMSPESGEWIDAPVREGEFVVILGDVMERFTNGVLKATPHRVVKTRHSRSSIIRFNAVEEDTLIAPLEKFGTPLYTPVTMKEHMETTMRNLELGHGAWDPIKKCSKTATYVYSHPQQEE
mmetsp:Transcript_13182/g.15391  ORF Transcript_13182/g.15391 Transcript_13182/m.15391 type:complete len:349 (-) Transcript_13182:32-1078(-)